MEYNVNLHMTSPSTNTSSICLFNIIILTLYYYLRFPCGSDGKEICLPCGRPRFDPWVGKIPWGREMLPTPGFWPREFHRLYSPWGHRESDVTEQLSLLGKQLRFHHYWTRSVKFGTCTQLNIIYQSKRKINFICV